MSSAACKVILCGDPPRAAIDSLKVFAKEVIDGHIVATPEIEAKLMQTAACMESANAILSDMFGKLMGEALP